MLSALAFPATGTVSKPIPHTALYVSKARISKYCFCVPSAKPKSSVTANINPENPANGTRWIDLNTFVSKAETSTEPAAPK